MKNLSEQEIAQMYDNLPEDLKDSIFSVDTTSAVNLLGRKYNLMVDKIGELGNETGMVMLGVTHPNEFIPNLAQRLEIDKETARAIAGDINEKIFKKVRDSLRKIHNIRDEGNEPSMAEHPAEAEQKSSAQFSDPSENLDDHRAEILKEIERDHHKEDIPAILKGNVNPFEAKTKEEIFKAPVEEKQLDEKQVPKSEKPKGYQGTDPYREQIE
ncbi:hypothetical protein C4572_00340 [Candidatus Parcubacteria bacterium]|nr:MAG: hypothetical protein C4572_00340 [Candidatus Parcubacteria bacterium]